MPSMLDALSLTSSTIETKYGGTDLKSHHLGGRDGGIWSSGSSLGEKKRPEGIRMITGSMMGAMADWIAGT